MKTITKLMIAAMLTMFVGCDKKNADLVEPFTANDFPQVLVFSDRGDGNLEDDDEFSFTLTFADRVDPEGIELGGATIPLVSDATVSFEIKEWEGMNNPAEYIKEVKALYEIDDCTTSEDKGIDLNLAFDKATGKGSVRFPKSITEIEIVFETDEDLFDDNQINKDERSITIVVTGVSALSENLTFKKSELFKYEILDDDAIHGDWEIDHKDPLQFSAFKKLFGNINEDLANLTAEDVDNIEFSIGYNEVAIKIELKQTRQVIECGVTEIVNRTIEVEAELESLDLYSDEGEIAFLGEVEQSDKSINEFIYEGEYKIAGNKLTLILKGEYDGEETEETTLMLEK